MHEMSERNIGNSTPFVEKCRSLNTAHQRAVQKGRRKGRDERNTGQSCQKKKRKLCKEPQFVRKKRKKHNEKRETSGILEGGSKH